MNLNELAIEYKKTNSSQILNLIFSELQLYLKKKASYIFYQQKFVKNRYEIEEFDKSSKKIIKKERVNTFKLCETKKVELVDVEQELNLVVMELLHKFDISKPFENYLNATLTNWRPEFIRTFNFVQGLNTVNESDLPEKNDRLGSLDDIVIENTESAEVEDLFVDLTEGEKKFIEQRRKFPDKNQSEIAEMMGITKQRVNQILISLKKKCKRHLTF